MALPELLSIQQTASILNIGRSRAYSLAASGELPGVMRIGRSVRVSRRRLEEWIEQRCGEVEPPHVTHVRQREERT
jgi:excisionase family DNA binding protein